VVASPAGWRATGRWLAAGGGRCGCRSNGSGWFVRRPARVRRWWSLPGAGGGGGGRGRPSDGRGWRVWGTWPGPCQAVRRRGQRVGALSHS
jgi:hypothetical protein